jgi:hypothetical protein
VPHEDPVLRALCEGRPPWQQVTIVAGRQGRAISVVQLRACGLSDKAIETATDKGYLHKVHRGVRAVGTPALSLTGRYWAAILAVGPDAALADLSGGALLGVRPWTGAVHVAAPTHRRGHHGVVVHQVAGLGPSMLCRRRRLPVMRAPHVMLDLAARLSTDALAIALNEALSKRALRMRELEAVLVERFGHHGLAALADAIAVIADEPGQGRTHGEFEELVMLLLRKLPGLPPYVRNDLVELGGSRLAKADIHFRGLGVMIELDSRTWHEQRLAMDSDRRRDQQALAAGTITFRITWRHAVREWPEVSADLLATVARASRNTRTAGRS